MLTEATVQSAFIFQARTYGGGMLEISREDEDCWVHATLTVPEGDSAAYAIPFQIILPPQWNGRMFFGADEYGQTTYMAAWALSAYIQNFAVVSSDFFGQRAAVAASNPAYDPQSRIDFAYEAVGKITGPARKIIEAAYAKPPDRMYIGGCTSDMGTRALIAAGRYPKDYDGFLAISPGVDEPKAGVQWAFEAQQFARAPELTPEQRRLVASRIVAKCDALDGALDDMVLDVPACQAVFDLQAEVPTCVPNPVPYAPLDGTCLLQSQKTAVANAMFGAHDSTGARLYANLPYDRGIASDPWMASAPAKLPLLFVTPPVPITSDSLPGYLQGFSMDTDAPKIYATGGGYSPSSMEFLRPPSPSELTVVRDRGGKLLLVHGTADTVFSVNATVEWYEGLRAADPDTASYARLFTVPGMKYCGGGPATEQFDAIAALVAWVEQGQAPDAMVASLRIPRMPLFLPLEYPGGWAHRTRPLCPYPQVARLKPGATDLESASSFVCQ